MSRSYELPWPEFGVEAGAAGGLSQQVTTPGYTRARNLTETHTLAQGHQIVSGRWLTHPVEEHTEYRADLTYELTVQVTEQNAAVWRTPRVASRIVKVEGGLANLRPEPLRPADPPGIPARSRGLTEFGAGHD